MLAEIGASETGESQNKKNKTKHAEVEERYVAEAEKSVWPKSSKVWEHFTMSLLVIQLDKHHKLALAC